MISVDKISFRLKENQTMMIIFQWFFVIGKCSDSAYEVHRFSGTDVGKGRAPRAKINSILIIVLVVVYCCFCTICVRRWRQRKNK